MSTMWMKGAQDSLARRNQRLYQKDPKSTNQN